MGSFMFKENTCRRLLGTAAAYLVAAKVSRTTSKAFIVKANKLLVAAILVSAIGAPIDSGAEQKNKANANPRFLRTRIGLGLVELRGFEPRTACMACKRSTN